MTHDELAQDLANSIRTDRRMTWTDLQLGPQGSVRPDVYALFKSYANPCPVAYECKVSASDFRADVTSGKWQAYLQYASGVYFACAGDLIKKSDVPSHCGLIVLRETWRVAKKAVLSPVAIPQEALIKLLIDGVEREGPRYRARGFSESNAIVNARTKFGELVARTVRDRLAVEHEISNATRTAKRIEEDAQFRAERIRIEATDLVAPMRAELCQILGLREDADRWEIASEVKRIRKDIAEHPAVAALRAMTNNLERVLEVHGYKETPSEEKETA